MWTQVCGVVSATLAPRPLPSCCPRPHLRAGSRALQPLPCDPFPTKSTSQHLFRNTTLQHLPHKPCTSNSTSLAADHVVLHGCDPHVARLYCHAVPLQDEGGAGAAAGEEAGTTPGGGPAAAAVIKEPVQYIRLDPDQEWLAGVAIQQVRGGPNG